MNQSSLIEAQALAALIKKTNAGSFWILLYYFWIDFFKKLIFTPYKVEQLLGTELGEKKEGNIAKKESVNKS